MAGKFGTKIEIVYKCYLSKYYKILFNLKTLVTFLSYRCFLIFLVNCLLNIQIH